ncbi:uncharacterized protein LOC126744768 [Anthonomus grandis grandis]|uniref:uncharacterized protein LOC126744768 n=1 Tax=Anthonomus grandis grandis TaxID=2921223 RepID=UPI002164FD5C|nr:uncharacterized protein LOC126744768 [Anthonomus grandis grandis]
MAGGSTTDDGDPENNVGDIMATLQLLVSRTNELNRKVDLLLNENQNLKREIASLKECKPSTAPSSVNSKLSYAAAIGTKNDSKVLVVKQKCPEKDVKQVKEDLIKKVNPSVIGAGLSLGKATKSGDVIIKCGNEKELTSIQSQIQNNMGDNYSVEVPKLLEHRIKVVGINESEYNLSDNEILAKIKSQNNVPEFPNRKIQIVLKKKRSSIKAKLTIFEKFVRSIEGLQNDTELLERSKIMELEQRLQDAQQLINQFDDVQTEIECLVDDINSELNEREQFNKITSNLPEITIDRKALKIPQHFKLADPYFEISDKIDLLLGADVFWNLLTSGKEELGSNGPILQNTRIGWIVSGPLTYLNVNSSTVCNLSQNILLQNQLTKFWEVEEISNKKPLSNEEALCEKHFTDTLEYSTEGRFIVSLPLKESPEKLGDSRELALKRFVNLERKLLSNDRLRTLYVDFLQEYEQLGHMTEIQDDTEHNEPEYYLPHHGVLKETSTTTKLRVVFDASAPSSTGLSLNNLQMVGPIIQSDLLSILLRFRTRAIVLSGDIKMMYRQVLINAKHRPLQKIVWRPNPNKAIKTYQLNTVTYGTTAGSFLAIRSLHQVTIESESEHPKTARIIQEDMYVDDLLTSVDSIEEAEYVVKTIYKALLKRGFELHKWRSNRFNCNTSDNVSDVVEFTANKDQDTKVLGLQWACEKDILTFKINPLNKVDPKKITKRVVLSRIATIFDPLGLTSPCIILAKVLLQKLWSENLTWDQPLPSHILTSWIHFSSELETLNEIMINRKVTCENPSYIALHGFSDASETSYGACIYVLPKNINGDAECNLLCAKSKVAPLKTLTMPRLELCAALILSQLLTKVLASVNININKVYCWSDSTIVLGWLRTSPNLLKQFVDNRVAEIQKLTSTFTWNHIVSQENPADLVSRGLKPKQLIISDLWWHGPKWLFLNEHEWPISNNVISNDLPEMRNCIFLTKTNTKSLFPFERFSNLLKIKRVMAYVLRFVNNARTPKNNRQNSFLTCNEINDAFNKLIKASQVESFVDELSILSSKRQLPKPSNILSLNPFIDDQGIMRVGGRLSNSEYSFSKKYPILLSPNHILTQLIMRYEHERLLHAGPQLLLSHIRDNFWPIAGRNLARKIVHNCVKCCRYNPQSVQPIMGDLPAARVQQALPFIKVGVDYAGPFQTKDRRGRGCKIIKCWVAVFVCMSTRAIHLELVLSLTSEDFLQAFTRFISKRGRPLEVFSDNGANFVRANKDLQVMAEFLKTNSTLISESIQNQGIKWHFIPPNSPHFGGIWEAGVKSFKYHFKRIVGSYTLFLFDLQTLVARIEAVLNSRPLCPLSSDPNDLSPLTPAHFLIGRSAMALAEPSVMHLPENRLSQYQLVQKVQEQFWNRWHREYMHELQQRKKWKVTSGSLHLGQLVLVKDNNLPPMKWRLGRVLNLVGGKDNVNRVASQDHGWNHQ